ncbi:hypothetical protein L596_015492 [Steinernema carpocapsae]|uniref:Uncharacterized protein n=1 Tax=Steinernema carpocapsae TaxID=34508 RepID=A0A4U5NFS2_STECR|nr:hypothetical protein L596_015492 [Steinernema carpocapsae]
MNKEGQMGEDSPFIEVICLDFKVSQVLNISELFQITSLESQIRKILAIVRLPPRVLVTEVEFVSKERKCN